MENCLFCKIVNNDIPSYKLYEDEICIVFLDISQLTLGHCLVVSKQHFDNLLEVSDDVLSHMSKVAKKIATSLSKLDGVKGFNIINNCNEISGQSIMHFHIHIIPRYSKEEMIIEGAKPNSLTNEEFNNLVNKIKENI